MLPKATALNYCCGTSLGTPRRCRGGSDSDKSSPRKGGGPRGVTWLPSRYRLQSVHVQRQAGLRWADQFDFAFYNRTRFAGLENGVANCYVNSLVQVGRVRCRSERHGMACLPSGQAAVEPL